MPNGKLTLETPTLKSEGHRVLMGKCTGLVGPIGKFRAVENAVLNFRVPSVRGTS
jgi:hypothetical protein